MTKQKNKFGLEHNHNFTLLHCFKHSLNLQTKCRIKVVEIKIYYLVVGFVYFLCLLLEVWVVKAYDFYEGTWNDISWPERSWNHGWVPSKLHSHLTEHHLLFRFATASLLQFLSQASVPPVVYFSSWIEVFLCSVSYHFSFYFLNLYC